MSEDEAAFLRTIREHPAADLPRLVYADWLEEQGKAEWAEFIRLQIELHERPVFVENGCGCGNCQLRRRERHLLAAVGREWFGDTALWLLSENWELPSTHVGGLVIGRGLPAMVRCSLRWYIGGPCERCRGDGYTEGEYRVLDGRHTDRCPWCHGTGRTPGNGADAVGPWPVTRVVVTDRAPRWIGHRGSDWHCWVVSDLTPEVFAALPAKLAASYHAPDVKWYETGADANAALSDTLLDLRQG